MVIFNYIISMTERYNNKWVQSYVHRFSVQKKIEKTYIYLIITEVSKYDMEKIKNAYEVLKVYSQSHTIESVQRI